MPLTDDDYALRERIGFALWLLRAARGWTQYRLAVASGKQRAQIANIEAGKNLPLLTTLFPLTEALGISLYGLILIAEAHKPRR